MLVHTYAIVTVTGAGATATGIMYTALGSAFLRIRISRCCAAFRCRFNWWKFFALHALSQSKACRTTYVLAGTARGAAATDQDIRRGVACVQEQHPLSNIATCSVLFAR